MRSSIKKILREQEREKHQLVSLDIDNENQLKRHIKKILREEYYHSSYTPDKWDLLEHDLKKYIDKLITDHKQNFHNDQYAVISAIEDILEGMFARVNR